VLNDALECCVETWQCIALVESLSTHRVYLPGGEIRGVSTKAPTLTHYFAAFRESRIRNFVQLLDHQEKQSALKELKQCFHEPL
jgi:hypothetical protein